MKYLDCSSLSNLAVQLESLELGDMRLFPKIEAYSTKLAGVDKKVAKSFENNPNALFPFSPLSPLNQGLQPTFACSVPNSVAAPSADVSIATGLTRKTFVNIVCTLNAAFPDYDFSSITPRQLVLEAPQSVVRTVDAHFGLVYQVLGDCFREEVWTAVQTEIGSLAECDIYGYNLSEMTGPDPYSEEDGKIWSFLYIFCNKKLKKFLLFSCFAKNRRSSFSSIDGYELDDTATSTQFGMDF